MVAKLCEEVRRREINQFLTPPGRQYGATQGNVVKRNWLRYGGFATLCKPVQRLNYHS
jgi:hypothetical protein